MNTESDYEIMSPLNHFTTLIIDIQMTVVKFSSLNSFKIVKVKIIWFKLFDCQILWVV